MTRRHMQLAAMASAVMLAAIISLGGCEGATTWDEPAGDLPGWVFDAPYYYVPSPGADLKAQDVGPDGDILHYYTHEPVVVIRRPDVSDSTLIPRLAVFYTADDGYNWHKAGYFGIDSSHFSFVPPAPGDYGIRFASADIPTSRLGVHVKPHRIYHVDTEAPKVVVQITPAKNVYSVGEQITVFWTVTDRWIDADAKVTLYNTEAPGQANVLGTDFPLVGSITVMVPPAAANHGVQFAVEATDKAGNVRRGFSWIVRTATTPPPASVTRAPHGETEYRPMTPSAPVGEPAEAMPPAAAPAVSPARPVGPSAEPVTPSPSPMAPRPRQDVDEPPSEIPPDLPTMSPPQPVTPPAPVDESSVIRPPAAPMAVPTTQPTADRALEAPGYRPSLVPSEQAHVLPTPRQ